MPTPCFKALLTTEGLAKSLLPEVDPITQAKPYVERIVAERYTPTRIKEDLFYNAVTMGSLMRRLPVTMSQFFDDLDQQRFRLSVSMIEELETSRKLNQRTSAMIFCLLTVGFCVSGVLALPHAESAGMAFLPKLFFLDGPSCFLFSGFCCVRESRLSRFRAFVSGVHVKNGACCLYPVTRIFREHEGL